ncbi:MAG: hypothetical protein ACRC0K_01305 [Fusobacteriaceae bacterium]
MKKVIVNCEKCGKKMKIGFNPAKYRCPHCKDIYNLTRLKSIFLKIKSFFSAIKETFNDSIYNIKTKYKNAVSTYKYMKSVKENMKRDPSWSNYHKEQNEEKKMKKADKGFFGKNLFKKK